MMKLFDAGFGDDGMGRWDPHVVITLDVADSQDIASRVCALEL